VLPHGNGATANAQSNESPAANDQDAESASPPAAANTPAVPVPPTGHGPTDLLKAFVSGQTPLPANWSIAGGELRADDRARPLTLACNQTGPFDAHIEYTPLGANTGLNIRFMYKSLHCSYTINGNAGNGFAREPHTWSAHTPNGPILTAGRRYSVVIQVREGSTCAFLDGQLLQRWQPNEDRLHIDPKTPIAPSELVFEVLHAPAIVHVLEVQMPGPGYVDTSKIVPVQSTTMPSPAN
jgi:hypothetical protein